MASLRMTLLDLLNKSEQGADPNFLRDGVRLLAQELMDAEVTDLVGAEPHERTAGRTTYRNGYRDREWDTRVGTLELQIPKLRQGTYFPSLLEPRRRHERALLSVVQEAYVHGVSTRAVDNLAEALGIKSISKDQVSRICKELDAQVHAFRTRRLDGEFPYLFLDATFEKVRENGRVISMAGLIAVGVRSTGEREVVGVDVGPAEDHEFWLQFLRQLASRGLSGVRLVISDSHLGLKQAVAQVFVGSTWQRCRVHFPRKSPSGGVHGHLIAETLEPSDGAIGDSLSVALVEVIGPEILVGAAVTQHPVGHDQNCVGHRDTCPFAAPPCRDASVLRRQVGLVASSG